MVESLQIHADFTLAHALAERLDQQFPGIGLGGHPRQHPQHRFNLVTAVLGHTPNGILQGVENIVLDLVATDQYLRIVQGKTIFLGKAQRGIRVQAGRVEHGRLHTGHRRSGSGQAAAKRMSGHFKAARGNLAQPCSQLHCTVVNVTAQAQALQGIVAKVLGRGITQATRRSRVEDFPGRTLEHDYRFGIRAMDGLVRQIDFGAECGTFWM